MALSMPRCTIANVSHPIIIHQVPTVLLDCFVADQSLPSVVPDEVLGGYEATRHLLQKGHQRIGFINDAIKCAGSRRPFAGLLTGVS